MSWFVRPAEHSGTIDTNQTVVGSHSYVNTPRGIDCQLLRVSVDVLSCLGHYPGTYVSCIISVRSSGWLLVSCDDAHHLHL